MVRFEVAQAQANEMALDGQAARIYKHASVEPHKMPPADWTGFLVIPDEGHPKRIPDFNLLYVVH